MTYVTRFGAIAWGILLVPLGRIAMVLDRHGQPMPALIGGGLAFVYLFGGAVIALAFDILVIPFNDYLGEAAGASGIPMPFARSDRGCDLRPGRALPGRSGESQTLRRTAHGELTLEAREAKEERSSTRAKQLSLVLGPTLIVIAVVAAVPAASPTAR